MWLDLYESGQTVPEDLETVRTSVRGKISRVMGNSAKVLGRPVLAEIREDEGVYKFIAVVERRGEACLGVFDYHTDTGKVVRSDNFFLTTKDRGSHTIQTRDEQLRPDSGPAGNVTASVTVPAIAKELSDRAKSLRDLDPDVYAKASDIAFDVADDCLDK